MKKLNRSSKKTRSSLRVESLEQRQLLAGITGGGTEVLTDLVHANGNVYDQVQMNGSSVTVTADAGQVTRVSFLDLSGDIVQVEFSGKGSLTVSLDSATFAKDVEAANYNQPGVLYAQGLASFTISGSDASTNFSVWTVGTGTAHGGAASSLFATGLTGGDHDADIQRLTIVADPANTNGSLFGGIRMANATFGGASGVVGISAANVQVQDVVRIGDIDASGSATPTLVFGDKSQFVSVDVSGGDLAQTNGKDITNVGSYKYVATFVDGKDSAGTALVAQANKGTFSDFNPTQSQSKTYTLTTSIDTLTGTSGSDTFQAAHTTTAAVVSTLDTINGAGGSDFLTISDAVGTAPVNGLTVTNVEKFEYTSVAGVGGGSLDTTKWTGLESSTLVLQAVPASGQSLTSAGTTAVSINASTTNAQNWTITGGSTVTMTNAVSAGAAGGSVSVTGAVGTTAVSITQTKTGGGTTLGGVTIADAKNGASDTSTISTVTIDGTGAASSIDSNALTKLTYTNASSVVSITDDAHTASAARTALDLTVNNLTTGAGVTDVNGSIKTLNITTTGKDSELAYVTASNALTGVTVAGDKNLTLTGTFGTGLASVTATGTGSLTVSVGADTAVTTSSGADTITLTAATKKVISTGAGDDKVTAALSSGALGSGGSIDGGEGTDTISLDIGAAATATGDEAFAGKITGFEALELTGTAGGTVNLKNLDLINNVTIAGNNTAAVTLSGLASGASVTYTSAQSADTEIDVPVAAIQNETLSLKIATKVAGIDVATLDTNAVNAVTIVSDDTASTTTGITHTVGFSDASLRTITVSGDAGLNIDTTGTGVTSIDASGLTKVGLTVTTGGLTSAATITGSAQIDTIVATAATKAVTVSAGNGDNSITIANANANIITAGSGADTITVGSGNNTITAGGGNDVINLNVAGNAGSNTVDAGDGNDTINVGKGVAQTVITLGGGNDTVAFKNAVPGVSGYYVTINGAGNSDILDFSAVDLDAANDGGVDDTTFQSAAVVLGQGVSFTDYLNEAAKTNTTGGGSVVKWFQYNGDTYVVLDNGAATTYNPTTDMVVKLTGLINLDSTGSGATSAAIAAGTGRLTI